MSFLSLPGQALITVITDGYFPAFKAIKELLNSGENDGGSR